MKPIGVSRALYAMVFRPKNRPCFINVRGWGADGVVREAIDYMLTVDFAILDLAATRRESLLRKRGR